jgi:hypothetical protein
MRLLSVAAGTVMLVAATAQADPVSPDVTWTPRFGQNAQAGPFALSACVAEDTVGAQARSTTPRRLTLHFADVSSPVQEDQPLHAAAIEHSGAYQKRLKIHRYASFATLPLFATQLALGQSIYNTASDSRKGAHAAVGAATLGLFGVNTVTGAWNLFGEGLKEKQGRRLRLAHGLLMMAADAGFVATWATSPNREDGAAFDSDKSTHRNLAIASIGTGTVGYLLMLFGSH